VGIYAIVPAKILVTSPAKELPIKTHTPNDVSATVKTTKSNLDRPPIPFFKDSKNITTEPNAAINATYIEFVSFSISKKTNIKTNININKNLVIR